jgi:hypothetical protein
LIRNNTDQGIVKVDEYLKRLRAFLNHPPIGASGGGG